MGLGDEMVSRRVTLIATSLLAGAVLGLPAQAASDTVTICQTLEPPILDPTAGAAQAIKEVTYGNIFEGLVAINAKGELYPKLATGWEIAPDNKTYTFHLRPGVTFSDGTAFSSADVKFTLERGAAVDSKNAQKWIFTPIAAIEAPDPLTVKITLKDVTSKFLFGLAQGDAVIVNAKSAATNATAPVGTGPYKLGTWSRGDRLTLVSTGAWWGGKPPIATATFRFIADAQAQVSGIEAGDCDALATLGAPEAIPQLKATKGLTVAIGATEGKTIVAMNNGKKPLNDVRVRRALAMAVDRNQVNVASVDGTGTPIGSHYTPNDPGYIDLTGEYPYDPAKAKALLTEAGYPNGFTLVMKVPPPSYARRGSEVVAAMLAQVGVTVTIENVEFPQWLDRVFKNRDYDLTIISHTEPRDIEIYSRPDYYFDYHSQKFNDLMKQIDVTIDDTARNKMLGEAQKTLADDSVNIFLYVLPKVTVFKSDLKGMWESWPLPATPLADLSWQ
jgi:peptide/nickel transport system substrate-binding protein